MYRKDVVNIKNDIQNNFIETKDLRIWGCLTKTFIFNFGENYQYAKFSFVNDEIYIYLRHSIPGFYNGPFVLKENRKNKYSYLTRFYVNKFELVGNELKIRFRHKYFIGAMYGLTIINIDDLDLKLLKSKFINY